MIFDTLAQKDFSPAPQNLAITLGPGPVSPLLTTLTGTNITYTGSVTMPDEAPYPCSLSNFQYLVGELYASTGTTTNLQTTSLNAPTSVTLNAMLQPAMSQVTYASISGGGTYTGTPAPTAPVQFLEGTTVVGTGTLGGNGTIASVTLAGVLPGVHTYTAQYPGDTTYTNPLTFGSVTVTVVGVPTTTAVVVSGSLVYGAPTAITATVTPTGTGTPTGSVQFLDGAVVLGTQPLQNGVATFTAAALAGGAPRTYRRVPGRYDLCHVDRGGNVDGGRTGGECDFRDGERGHQSGSKHAPDGERRGRLGRVGPDGHGDCDGWHGECRCRTAGRRQGDDQRNAAKSGHAYADRAVQRRLELRHKQWDDCDRRGASICGDGDAHDGFAGGGGTVQHYCAGYTGRRV